MTHQASVRCGGTLKWTLSLLTFTALNRATSRKDAAATTTKTKNDTSLLRSARPASSVLPKNSAALVWLQALPPSVKASATVANGRDQFHLLASAEHAGRTGRTCSIDAHAAAILWRFVNAVNTRQTRRPRPPDTWTTTHEQHENVLCCIFYDGESQSTVFFPPRCETLEWWYGLRVGTRVSSSIGVYGWMVRHHP